MEIPSDIAFESSYVLGVTIQPYAVTIAMDFALMPAHPRYVIPAPDEQECYVDGALSITRFKKLVWIATGIEPSTDAAGERDYGTLDEFTKENGKWRLVCDVGVIEVTGGILSLSLGRQD